MTIISEFVNSNFYWTIIRLIAKLIPKSIDFTKQRFDDINFNGKTFLDIWLDDFHQS